MDELFASWCEGEDEDDTAVYEKSSSNSNKFPTSKKTANCEIPVRAILNISNFGTYSITLFAANGSVVDTDVSVWSWVNIDQTALNLGDDEEYNIIDLDDNTFIMTATFYDYETLEDGTSVDIVATDTFVFNKTK